MWVQVAHEHTQFLLSHYTLQGKPLQKLQALQEKITASNCAFFVQVRKYKTAACSMKIAVNSLRHR